MIRTPDAALYVVELVAAGPGAGQWRIHAHPADIIEWTG